MMTYYCMIDVGRGVGIVADAWIDAIVTTILPARVHSAPRGKINDHDAYDAGLRRADKHAGRKARGKRRRHWKFLAAHKRGIPVALYR